MPALENRPEIRPGLDFYWEAYLDLNTSRQFAGGPIPWSAMNDYAARYGMRDADEFADFSTIIRRVDAGYLEAVHKKDGGKD